eukprot:760859_1
MLYSDGFGIFRTGTRSSTGVSAAILNLSREERFQTDNILWLSIIPGPRQPGAVAIINFSEPIATELLAFHPGGPGVEIPVNGRYITVHMVLISVVGDSPAQKKLLGVGGWGARHSCNNCSTRFQTQVGAQLPSHRNYSIGLQEMRNDNNYSFNRRARMRHMTYARRWMSARTQQERTRFRQRYNVRWSAFLSLDYIDISIQSTVDVMHQLYLGIGKMLFKRWWNDRLSPQMKSRVQQIIQLTNPTRNSDSFHNRLDAPHTVTAEEWKSWILIYSLPSIILSESLNGDDDCNEANSGISTRELDSW